MKKLIILLCSLCVSGLVFAEVETKVLTIDGYGGTYPEAIQNGLIEALKQVEGVSIDSQKSYAKSIREHAVSSTDEGSTHDVMVNERTRHRIKEATQGVINEYRVVNSQDNVDGQWHVQLEIQLLKYRTPGISPHSLRKIAAIPFRTKKSIYSVLGKSVSSKEISRQFNQKLITELTQSRRFSVIDREYMNEFAKERNFLLSADASKDEQMKVGEALGVDYMLLGTITEFKTDVTKKYIKTLNETILQAKAQINVDFRIMVMATRQIKWSDTVKVSLTPKQLKQVIKHKDHQMLVDFVLEEAAKKVVHTSLDNIYPLKILKVAGKKAIYLNQGGKMTKVGQLLDVYTPGESIDDPDTGLKIKIDGEKVAIVKVTKVQAKYSLAKLLKGDINRIQKGAILRQSDAKLKSEAEEPYRQKVMQPAW